MRLVIAKKLRNNSLLLVWTIERIVFMEKIVCHTSNSAGVRGGIEKCKELNKFKIQKAKLKNTIQK